MKKNFKKLVSLCLATIAVVAVFAFPASASSYSSVGEYIACENTLRGDCNRDGVVDMCDMVYLQQWLNYFNEHPIKAFARAVTRFEFDFLRYDYARYLDANNDGYVGQDDVWAIRDYIMHA